MRWMIDRGGWLLLLMAWTQPLRADDSPQWRGPHRNGTATAPGWSFPKTPASYPTVWKAAAGTGFSSVVVASGRVYTLGNADDVDWGYAGSPLVLDEKLIVSVGWAGTALDKMNGHPIWDS